MSPDEDATLLRPVDASAFDARVAPSATTPARAPDVLVALVPLATRSQPYVTVASAKARIELLMVRYVIADNNLMLSMLFVREQARVRPEPRAECDVRIQWTSHSHRTQ